MPLKAGDLAPSFRLKDEAGQVRTLDEFRGKKVVLYFYPKDNTPGCTKEACNFRDGYGKLQHAGIVILGISYDSPVSHKKFKEKYHLPFTLLSDEKKEVARAYGTASGIFGAFLAKRVTFLIDENGRIIHIDKNVDVRNHAEDVLNIFTEWERKNR